MGGRLTAINVPSLTTINSGNAYQDVLHKHIEMTHPAKYKEPRHPVRHYIVTKGPPCTDQPPCTDARQLSPERLRFAKREVESWIADGIVSPSSSPYASALLLRCKKDGSWRICGDYRRLNRTTSPDKYSIPRLHDFVNRLHGCTIFTTLDLGCAFFNIPMAPEDRHKTVLITPFGLFEFNVMPLA